MAVVTSTISPVDIATRSSTSFRRAEGGCLFRTTAGIALRRRRQCPMCLVESGQEAGRHGGDAAKGRAGLSNAGEGRHRFMITNSEKAKAAQAGTLEDIP